METLNIVFGLFFYVMLGLIVIGAAWFIIDIKCARNDDDYLDIVYVHIWNGTEEDRIYAWFRTIEHLKQWNYDEELIRKATYRMNMLRDTRSRKMFINKKGKIIEATEVK